MITKSLFRYLWPALIALASPSAWPVDYGVRIDPPRTIHRHHLVDQNGRQVLFPSPDAGWQLVIFGYTHCPDVCPMTLHKTADLVSSLGNDRGRVQIVFVSIDSTRDDVATMREFIGRFDVTITGLTGDPGSLQAAGNEFEVLTRRYQGKTAMAYRLEHSSFIYLLDPWGRLRMLFSGAVKNEAIAKDLRQLWRNQVTRAD